MTRQILSNITRILIILLTIIGVYSLSNYYGSLMEFQTDFILKTNFLLIILIGILAFIDYLINSKRHLNFKLNPESKISTDESYFKKIALKRQFNFFSIPIVLLGLSNLILYLIFLDLLNNYWVGAVSLIMAIPIYGYFENSKELKESYQGKTISYSINESNLDYFVDKKMISYDLKKLNFLQRISNELILIDTKTKQKIIVKLK